MNLAAATLERAEILAPGERMTKKATAALAMYNSPNWVRTFSYDEFTEDRGSMWQLRPDHGWCVRFCNEVQGEIPWR